jgi:FAD binding domain
LKVDVLIFDGFSTSENQIQSIVVCAASSNMTVSARSGGHSYAAYALEGDIVVDLSNLKGVTVGPDGTALVQTGNRLGEVATKIFNQGERALAHGSCPYVRKFHDRQDLV